MHAVPCQRSLFVMLPIWQAALLAGVCALVDLQTLGVQASALDEFASSGGPEDQREFRVQGSSNVPLNNVVAVNQARSTPKDDVSGVPWQSMSWGLPIIPLSPIAMGRLFPSQDGLRRMVRRSGRFSQGAAAGGADDTNEDMRGVGGDNKADLASKGCFFKVCSFGTHNLQK
ncbi:hypothetical protein BIW11_08798 [Tropilaelaps mercedesae]|uniref:Uncharacterized protein n=1 Tax=Tropilaelaps mercedesae TaxID=418985 RepID=A0A1V9XN97_9ACAR|nr:hypothetical protein BIW11_08798 [Tropilaelaps mercedesae]